MAITVDTHKALLAIANVRKALANLEQPFTAIGQHFKITTNQRYVMEV